MEISSFNGNHDFDLCYCEEACSPVKSQMEGKCVSKKEYTGLTETDMVSSRQCP